MSDGCKNKGSCRQPQAITSSQTMLCLDIWAILCMDIHCKNLGGQCPPFCLPYQTNCPFVMLWETKWWDLPD